MQIERYREGGGGHQDRRARECGYSHDGGEFHSFSPVDVSLPGPPVLPFNAVPGLGFLRSELRRKPVFQGILG